MATNNPITEAQLLRTTEDFVRRALPDGWKVHLTREPGRRQSRPDGVLELTSPGANAPHLSSGSSVRSRPRLSSLRSTD
jgi:hypothetical protein